MDMLVDDYTMVVKGLDQITEAAAKTLLEAIVEQVGSDLSASVVDIWQTQVGRDGIILHPLLCTENGQWRNAAPFQITDVTRGMFAWVIENESPVCLHHVRECLRKGVL